MTGAAAPTTALTLCRFVNEWPRSWSTTSRFRKSPYCTGTGRSMPRKWRARSMHSGVARWPHASRPGSAGTMKKITYVIAVTATKSAAAHSSRLIR